MGARKVVAMTMSALTVALHGEMKMETSIPWRLCLGLNLEMAAALHAVDHLSYTRGFSNGKILKDFATPEPNTAPDNQLSLDFGATPGD